MRTVRYAVLALSAAVVVFGALIATGVMVPAHMTLPGEYRIVIGGVVVLYGLYRFVVTFNRPTRP
jgi:hypothetical protein